MTCSIAFYAVANDAYVPTAVIALRSFQRWHPELAYFLLGTIKTFSPQSHELIRRYGIELIDVDESVRFVTQGTNKDRYPVEVFYPLKAPELLAERGYDYSIEVDGDVFGPEPFDIPRLKSLFKRTRGYAARPVGSLARTLMHKRQELNEEFDFSPKTVAATLGLTRRKIWRRYEAQAGIIYWNNAAMAKIGLFEKCVEIFRKCHGCFEADQDLLAFATAIHDIPVRKIGHPYNFGFFEDSPWVDHRMQSRFSRGQFAGVYALHFVFAKPWAVLEQPTPVKIHFVNAWRDFVCHELGADAGRFFREVQPIGVSEETLGLVTG